MNRSNFGAVRLPLLGAAVLASFAVSLSAQVVEKGRTYADLVATHPCNSGSSGRLARITDAQSSSSIGGGGGSTQVWAVCNGVDTWTLTAIGGGAGGAGDVLLAGDADGQTIQGFTGADKARIDIGVSDASGVRLIGTGATPGFIYAYTDGVFASSPDFGTSIDLYDGGIDIVSDGSSSFYGVTATNIGVAGGPTSINGSRVNVASFQTPPTNANDTCTAGDTIDTATFHYFCAATNTWVRAAMATW